MSKAHYIFVGGPENLDYWNKEQLKNNQWFWSANKHVKPGDIGFIYLSAPASRIVGQVDIVGEPFFHHGTAMFTNPHMTDKWCVEVANPVYFGHPSEKCTECHCTRDGHALASGWHEKGACEVYKKPKPEDWPLSMASLRNLFRSDWGWVRYPRGNTRVPDGILPLLQELIDGVTKNKR